MIRRTLAVALLFCATSPFSPPVLAADFHVEGETLFLDGPIVRGDAETFVGMVNANPGVKRVSIHSPGGDLGTGLKLGKAIRARKLETYVEGGMREAASAAAYAFMGGEVRVIKGTRGVGVHAFYTPASDVRTMLKQRASDEFVKAINEFERVTQESTMAVVEYVIEMIGDTRIVSEAVKSGSDEMMWLGTDKLIELKVATKKIDLTPEEIPDLDWVYGQVIAGLSEWLEPGYLPPTPAEGETAIDDDVRANIERYLASDRALTDLRGQLDPILARVQPANRLRAQELVVIPTVRSIVRSFRASVEKAREAQGSP